MFSIKISLVSSYTRKGSSTWTTRIPQDLPSRHKIP